MRVDDVRDNLSDARHGAIAFAGSQKPRKRKKHAYVFGFVSWKTFISDWLPGHRIVRKNKPLTTFGFYMRVAPSILWNRGSRVYIWSYKDDGMIGRFCKRWRVPYQRVEDGFIRSVALGAERSRPLSLIFDSPALYFDATVPTTLEKLLNHYDFDNDPVLMGRAHTAMRRLIDLRLSKYNSSKDVEIEAIYGPKTRKRILVVGQVEGDMSIKKGCQRDIDNNDLVRLAAAENPGAQIIYKPHPEVLRGIRKNPPQSNPNEVCDIAMVLGQDVTLADAFRTVDHVYTITSLSGFEALMRGIPVTTVGCPFYSGWGVTDARQPNSRRKRQLTVEQIFAAAYILYPKYMDPESRRQIEIEEAIDILIRMKMQSMAFEGEPVQAPVAKTVEEAASIPVWE
ncbi:MAG: beta-3-deoxy-D-manno-oct-2-ulosonic acid transferase [Shinella sp.]|nr:MAG: beta-3-deoxy-D-manno-oct-2-ulosonic acid transferase [Shinella sp.]